MAESDVSGEEVARLRAVVEELEVLNRQLGQRLIRAEAGSEPASVVATERYILNAERRQEFLQERLAQAERELAEANRRLDELGGENARLRAELAARRDAVERAQSRS